jgi:hypothetical protein
MKLTGFCKESPIRRIPVEIWQLILVFSQSVNVGPLNPLPEHGFMENILVFQDDCSVSSAYCYVQAVEASLQVVERIPQFSTKRIRRYTERLVQPRCMDNRRADKNREAHS